MAQIKIYADEDAMDQDLVAALRSRGVMVVTATEAFMVEKKDDEHLALAAELGCALYSFNSCDYQRIHGEWMADGRDHFGLIMGVQKKFSVGEQMRRILSLRAALSAEDMRNRLEFLASWR